MQDKPKVKPPIIINDGIVYKKKDMLILLRDLGRISYFELVGNEIKALGKGYVMRLCCNSEEPSLFLNGRIYINVSAFDYLKLIKEKNRENTIFELYSDNRVLRLIPEENGRPFVAPVKEFLVEKPVDIFSDEFLPPDELNLPPDFLDGGFLGN